MTFVGFINERPIFISFRVVNVLLGLSPSSVSQLPYASRRQHRFLRWKAEIRNECGQSEKNFSVCSSVKIVTRLVHRNEKMKSVNFHWSIFFALQQFLVAEEARINSFHQNIHDLVREIPWGPLEQIGIQPSPTRRVEKIQNVRREEGHGHGHGSF